LIDLQLRQEIKTGQVNTSNVDHVRAFIINIRSQPQKVEGLSPANWVEMSAECLVVFTIVKAIFFTFLLCHLLV
jgi:hypothetical protein